MIRRHAGSGSPGRRRPPRWVTGLVVAATVVLGSGAALGGFEAVDHARGPAPAPASPTVPLPRAAAAATDPPPAPGPGTPATSAPAATPAGVAEALAPLVDASGIGARLRADVIDVDTGANLYSRAASAPTAPASTAKLLTAAAILTVRSGDDTFTTRVVAGPGNSVVLVGGGDPTLSAAAAGHATVYAEAARISTLAGQVRHALPTGTRITRVVVDDALFTGPSISPAWDPGDVPSDYGAAITATMVDGGRPTPSAAVRSATPDLDAGHALAAALGVPSVPVTRGPAPAGARALGTVESAPVDVLVEQMLQQSDNVIAEVLGRQVAVAKGSPASFTGATAAIRSVVTGLGVDPGTGMRDASGLAAADRLSPRTLTQLLAVIVRGSRPNLSSITTGLPVADWSGTLADRYASGPAATARGLIRAKTGTLTGVSTIAGYLHDRSGRLIAFAFMADRAGASSAAEAALDRVAARLSRCGCS